MAEAENVVCENPGCQVAVTGKCLEGLSVDKCPHRRVSKESAQPSSYADEKPAASEEPISVAHKIVNLPSGDLLNQDAGTLLLRGVDCRVIALIGPNDAGKTTLVASLYEMFHQGSLGGFRFSGSRTLYGFEQVCHPGRAASRRVSPRTERTSYPAGLQFFHLKLMNELSGGIIDLLFSERAGEYYRSAADDPRIVSDFPEIGRADCVSIVVDGKRLADISARHNVKSNTELILQGLVDGNALSPEQRLVVVLTKYDEILNSNAADRANADFTGLTEKIRGLFAEHFSEVEVFRTAARPAMGNVTRGLGLADLLRFWARPPYIAAYQQAQTPSSRAFSRLKTLERR